MADACWFVAGTKHWQRTCAGVPEQRLGSLCLVYSGIFHRMPTLNFHPLQWSPRLLFTVHIKRHDHSVFPLIFLIMNVCFTFMFNVSPSLYRAHVMSSSLLCCLEFPNNVKPHLESFCLDKVVVLAPSVNDSPPTIHVASNRWWQQDSDIDTCFMMRRKDPVTPCQEHS